MTLFQRLRILPLLVLVAGLSLVVRVGEFAAGVQHAGQAFAQHEVGDEPPPMPSENDTHSDDTASSDDEAHMDGEEEKAAAEDQGVPPFPMAGEGEKIEWKDASESDFEYSEVREDLYKDLADRRKDLEERERALATREALLEAAERELNQKLREMTAVRNEIEGLLTRQSEEEQERINSLVRIYEGMKAKDAARIFNTLDIDVLISVMARMSERKSAPILAEMNPERARSVTILLAQQKQIPEIPPQ
ncbi:MAG: flagellar protein FlbB [Rhodospirillales bacterium]|nr:flagellar protein FlbB [Rhodospirillales bacterium]